MANALLPSKNVTVPVAVDGETVAAKTTDCPTFDGLGLDVSVMVVLYLTVCIKTAEVLLLLLVSPLYVAVIEWFPTERLEVEKVALPPPKVPVPNMDVPSRNVTVPVAVAGATVAVNVTDWPSADGLRLEVSVVVVEVLRTV